MLSRSLRAHPLRSSGWRGAVVDGDPLVRPVGARDGGVKLLVEVTLVSSYSVKMMTRMSFQLRAGALDRSGTCSAESTAMSSDPGIGKPRAASAISVISSSSFCSLANSLPRAQSVRRADRGRGDRLRPGPLLRPAVLFRRACPVVVVADAVHRANPAGSGTLAAARSSLPGLLPTGAGPCGGGPASVRAKASTDDSSRC